MYNFMRIIKLQVLFIVGQPTAHRCCLSMKTVHHNLEQIENQL